MLNKSSKLLQYRSIFLIILFATSLLFTSYIKNSKAQVQEDEETAYLKFASLAVKDSSNSSSSKNSTSTTTTQIPETAKGPPIPAAKGYLVQEIRNHLYWVTDGSYNTMFLVTDKGVVAVDAPPTIGKNYLKAIKEVTDKPVTYVIYSHAHLDHIGAAGIFPKNATFIAQQETAAELQRAKSVAKNVSMVPPIPTVTFTKNYTLQIGNQSLKLDYYGVNHLPGNIFIYAPNQKVLMLVDIIFPGWVPFPYLGIAKDVAGFIKAHDIALNNYDFDTIVAGHLTRLGTRNDVVIQKEFVSDLERAAGKANQEIPFSKIASQVGSFENPWLIFSRYIDAINENCMNDMLPKWVNRLGGAQQFMSTHCFSMAESGRVDPTVNALLQK
ncbi:MAG TPA: MBL fold metallo-hydrolase [Nitrososphaeraceae archaeon]|jgi:glyoxylase-like metal-dependent hydrolase (beta-lactamase superfamily II)|nr:MBL fold metallo-hydrolase [Nitrososphaeraceae archaeon]